MDLLQRNPFDGMDLQWFAKEEETFESADDAVLTYGDEELPMEEEGEASEVDTDQPAKPTAQEVLFAIMGEDGKEQQLPFKKLTPEIVQAWYDAHKNKGDWSKSNTEKAKQLADERREHEAQKQQYDTLHQQTERWVEYFKSNAGLQQLVTAFVQGRIPQNVLAQILGQQTGQQPAGAQPATGYDPYLNQMAQRLAALENTLQKEREVRLQDKQLSEREKAMQAILPHIPEEKRDAFKQYMEQATANMTDLQAMYKILADSFMWTNKDELIKKVQQQAVEKLQKKKGAGVETGEQQSAVELPSNVDVSGTKDIRQIYEQFAEQFDK